MPAAPVLASRALLAYFRQEPGGERVKELLHQAARADRPLHLTEVNYAEVNDTIRRRDGEAAWAAAARILETLPIEFHPVTRPLADTAAGYKARFNPNSEMGMGSARGPRAGLGGPPKPSCPSSNSPPRTKK